LIDGRRLHELVSRYYAYESEFSSERVLVKASGRLGRADLFLWVESDRSHALVAEVKWTDWDHLERRATTLCNLARHRRQVWSYLEGRIFVRRGLRGESVELENITRQGALIYPFTPRSVQLQEVVEAELADWGITTNWFDQPPSEGTPGAEAWTALSSGEIPTRDLRGSARWSAWLDRIKSLPTMRPGNG
jgi:hypothetical protein